MTFEEIKSLAILNKKAGALYTGIPLKDLENLIRIVEQAKNMVESARTKEYWIRNLALLEHDISRMEKQ